MTLRKWFHPKNQEERWEVIFFNLDLSIFFVCCSIVFAIIAIVKKLVIG